MDKKAKKRVEVLKKKITQTQQLLAAAKQQPDDPEERAIADGDSADAGRSAEAESFLTDTVCHADCRGSDSVDPAGFSSVIA